MNNKSFILVFNCGSSSIKFALTDPHTGEQPIRGLVENIHADDTRLIIDENTTALPSASYEDAMHAIIKSLENTPEMGHVQGVGHRVVHGGEDFTKSTLINDDVLNRIKELSVLAPLHNPANAMGIEIASALFNDLPHVAVFDTAFHQSLPAHAFTYALPFELYEKHGVRRYGFHGTSHLFVTRESAIKLGKPLKDCSFISAHLGNGCSVAAVKGGKSLDTSMGFTPLEGLVMGTRSGDLDPSLSQYISEKLNMPFDDVINLFNKKSGLLGLSGVSMDMRAITQAADEGNKQAALAIEVASYRLAKYIASYIVPLGRIDALIFTGGIGENAKNIRAKTLTHLKPLGFEVSDANNNHGKNNNGVITTSSSTIAMVTPTNEEWIIAQDTFQLAQEKA